MKNVKALGFLVEPDYEKAPTEIMPILCHLKGFSDLKSTFLQIMS
jgi:hypothetical protein